jgi:pyruvate dehydrogenase E1 component alpha subunit
MSTTTDPPAAVGEADAPGGADLLAMLEGMLRIRRFEERTAQSYQQAKIGGFCHLYIGQEAVAVGAVSALRDDDPVITAYRDHGLALARGMPPDHAMAEMFGKSSGCCKGKGGSMHLFDKAHHMYGGHAIVAGQCPLGAGLAFAIRYLGQDRICAMFLGDGALNQGSFHEAMNLAAIWRLPLLALCENNQYSMGTHIARGTSKADDLAVKAAAYGIRYDRCDGMDVLDVRQCVRRQAALARAGEGPVFVHVETYRYKGHSMSDPQKYRTRDEVSEYQEQDPIARLAARIQGQGLATPAQLEEVDARAKEAAARAVRFAAESADPPLDELYTDVYGQPFAPYSRGEPAPMRR